ncbi:MAG: mechanosensitive ion channel family protein [Deferribacteraceae bacterium]|jgi:small-conductance mechanosensitive channel|nr:mechanosensitive ion channel family protein [Deferribacteraceae bacterium]
MDKLHEALAALSRQPYFVTGVIKTVALLFILIILRAVVIKQISSWHGLSNDSRRRWVVNTRNISAFLFFAGMIFIWGYQIKELAFSVAAVAVAFVMIFKEVITNFMGGIARTVSSQFGIGDRISVGTHRGDVIDTNMLTTTLLEIGPGQNLHQYTGSTISVPNAMLLTTPVVNESFMHEYLLHVFHVPVLANSDWRRTERLLLLAANAVCEPYLKKARKYMEELAIKHSVEPASSDPRTSIIFKSPTELDLVVRVPVPSLRKGKVEQEIIRKYLDLKDEEVKDV